MFTLTVSINAGCAWTAAVTGDFLSITAGASGTGSGEVHVKVAANSGEERSGTVTIGSVVATAKQSAATPTSCAFSVSPSTVSAPASGLDQTITITMTQGTNCTWTAGTSDAFLSVAGTASGSVHLVIAANASAARSGSAVIAGHTVGVTQEAVPPVDCQFGLPHPSVAPLDGGIVTIPVQTQDGCVWTPHVFGVLGAGFLTLLDTGSHKGSGSFRVQVPPNNGWGRSENYYINTVNTIQSYVVQPERPGACAMNVTPRLLVPSASQGSVSFHVQYLTGSYPTCSYNVSSFESFAIAGPAPLPFGIDNVYPVQIQANSGDWRYGYIEVQAGVYGQPDYHTIGVNVIQLAAAPACTYTVSLSGINAPAAGGVFAMTITPQTGPSSCFPSDSFAGDSFLTLSGVSQISATQFFETVTVAPNTTGAPRSENMVIAGRVIVVQQGG